MKIKTTNRGMLSRARDAAKARPWLGAVVSPAYLAYLALANHLVNKVPLISIRHLVYRLVYRMKIGRGSVVAMGCRFFRPDQIQIGRNSRIHFGCLVDGRRRVTIGDNVDISFDVKIFSLQHDVDDPDYKATGAPVVIGDRVSVNTNSIILPGVTIGEGAVIAAGAVVAKDVPPFTVVGGVPAKPIRARNSQLRYVLSDVRYFH